MKWCWFRQLQCLNLHPTSDITSDNYSYLKFNEKYFHCLEEVLLEVLWGNWDNFFFERYCIPLSMYVVTIALMYYSLSVCVLYVRVYKDVLLLCFNILSCPYSLFLRWTSFSTQNNELFSMQHCHQQGTM